jgi:hypothetical protein
MRLLLLRFCDTEDPEDKVIVPMEDHQALTWAEENYDGRA